MFEIKLGVNLKVKLGVWSKTGGKNSILAFLKCTYGSVLDFLKCMDSSILVFLKSMCFFCFFPIGWDPLPMYIYIYIYWKKTGCLIMYSYTVFHADLGRSTIFSGHMSTKGLLQGLSAAQKRYQLNRLKVGTVEKFLLMSTVRP